MRIADLDFLIVPGLGGSGDEHWQTGWAKKLPRAQRIEQDSWSHPRKEAWVDRIVEAIKQCDRPALLIAHSLGAVAAAAAAPLARGKVAAAFLVAPADVLAPDLPPEIDPAFRHCADGPIHCPGLLIASRNDPFASWEASETMAHTWGVELVDAGEAGHINIESGHGPWPEGLLRLATLLKKI